MMIIVIIFFSLLANLIVFMPFFSLGLFGDDWLAIYRYSYYLDYPKHLGPYSTEYFNHFKYFLNAYGTQDMLMAFLYNNFGSGSNVYFVLSYILRLSAGFSIYFPAFYLTKNRFASVFATIFFLFSSIGLEASNWVFNMPSYIFIIFFNFFLYCSLIFYKETQLKYLILTYLFFTLTFISTPIRAHGLLSFALLLEFFWLIKKDNRKFFKFSVLRIIIYLLILSSIFLLGFKETISGNSLIGISRGITNSIHLLSQNHFDFLFYPLITVGSMLIPESFFHVTWSIGNLNQLLFNLIIPYLVIFFLIITLLKLNIKISDNKFMQKIFLLGAVWSCLVIIIYKNNISLFSNPVYTSLLLIGGYLLILILYLSKKLVNPFYNIFLIGIGWTFISFLYPWWVSQNLIILTHHRYLIISGIGISLILAGLISLSKNYKSYLILSILCCFLIFLHTISTRDFLQDQFQKHNREVVEKIWSQMPYISEVGKSSKPLILYFEGDGTNSGIIGDSITFGFPPHMGIIYKITEENLMPIPMSEWKDVTSAVIDGKSLAPHNRPQKPIPVEQIYSFRLEGEDNLIDTTEGTRKKLIDLK